MTVEKQSFIQPVGPRIPVPTEITNVIATLHGSQPESANRIYLVSGPLDSRCTDVLDFTCDAPGAGDDGSGVAAVLEMARVMATHHFDATIKFVAFSGEEQGTFGSLFYATQAKAAGRSAACDDASGAFGACTRRSDGGHSGRWTHQKPATPARARYRSPIRR
jgi:Zn-dependent M28 family amino/carboxypeptidase